MECIILAGGLGTRLKGTIGDYPKCMAAVNEKPFLHYIFRFLERQNCSRVILSLGYRHEVITSWLQSMELPFVTDFVVEPEPLGTGGGIKLAMEQARSENTIVLNGDTFFDVDLGALLSFHSEKKAATTLALKQLQQFDRYGSVHIDDSGCILSFEEKKYQEKGLINGGIYIINKEAFDGMNLPGKFSFEKDYLEAFVGEGHFYGKDNSGYFIDIGIPEDYQKAQEDFKQLFR